MSVLFVSQGCDNTSGDVIDRVVDILLVDKENNNLLKNGVINPDDLNLYYLINGEKKLYYNGNYDAPKGYLIWEDQDNRSILRIFANDDIYTPVTLVEYTKNDVDTIKCEFHRDDSNIIVQKVWYNSELKWEVGNNNFPGRAIFTVTK